MYVKFELQLAQVSANRSYIYQIHFELIRSPNSYLSCNLEYGQGESDAPDGSVAGSLQVLLYISNSLSIFQ